MSLKKDARQVAALVTVLENIAAGKTSTLGDVVAHVFGWGPERVFVAIDHAVHKGLIVRNAESKAVRGPQGDPK